MVESIRLAHLAGFCSMTPQEGFPQSFRQDSLKSHRFPFILLSGESKESFPRKPHSDSVTSFRWTSRPRIQRTSHWAGAFLMDSGTLTWHNVIIDFSLAVISENLPECPSHKQTSKYAEGYVHENTKKWGRRVEQIDFPCSLLFH